MDLKDIYRCFAQVGGEVNGVHDQVTGFFKKKDGLIKSMHHYTTIYLAVAMDEGRQLAHFIAERELPFWERLEHTAKPFGKLLIKSGIKKIAPESYEQALGIAGQIEDIRGIAYQMKSNLKEQCDYLLNMDRQNYAMSLKVFDQKYNEQKHLYRELLLERERIVSKLAALCPTLGKEAKNVREGEEKWYGIGSGVGAFASIILLLTGLGSLNYTLDTAAMQKLQFEWGVLMGMVGTGGGATLAVKVSGDMIRENAGKITLFMRDVRSLL